MQNSKKKGVNYNLVNKSGFLTDRFKRPLLLVFSAADEGGIHRISDAYASHFTDLQSRPECFPENYIQNLAFTLFKKRNNLPWKSFAIISSGIKILKELDMRLSKPLRTSKEHVPRISYVFTGQGAQWPTMGRDLFAFPSCRRELNHIDSFLKSEFGYKWSLVGMYTNYLYCPTFSIF